MNRILYIYVETTGLDPKTGGLTEVACIVEVDGVEKDRLFLEINPFSYGREIVVVEEALPLTGKTVEDLKSCPNSATQFKKFLLFLDKYCDPLDKRDLFIINGYNSQFDIGFIKEWFSDRQANFHSYFHYKSLDVFSLVGYLRYMNIINTKNDNLLTICEHFGVELNDHNAMYNIVAIKKLHELLTLRYIKVCERIEKG